MRNRQQPLIDTGLRIYDRDAEVGKEQASPAASVFVKMVYDLIAKIWAETDPVYDLPAIDRRLETAD
jgi:hypothetical protein